MKFKTVDGTFSSEQAAIKDVQQNQIRRLNPKNGRNPVCVKSQVGSDWIYGVQYWTPEMISVGKYKNSDGSVAILCESNRNKKIIESLIKKYIKVNSN